MIKVEKPKPHQSDPKIAVASIIVGTKAITSEDVLMI